MPTSPLMVWIPSQKRWTKRYAGRRYYISCRQLGIKPETKEASILAANAWWRDQQASVDHAEKLARQQALRKLNPTDDILSALTGGRPWTDQEGIAASAAAYLESLPPSPAAEALADHIQQAAFAESEQGSADAWEGVAAALGKLLLPALLERVVVRGEMLPDKLREMLPPARAAQLERAAKEMRGEQTADPSKTVGAMKDDWLLTLKMQVSIDSISATRYDRIAQTLCHFAAFLGEGADISTINAESLEGFYNFCLSKIAERREDEKTGWSPSHSKQVFAVAKQWVFWLSERGTIPLPTNYHRKWRFGPTIKQIKTWEIEEVCRVVGAAKGKLRLCLLLMLNCGFQQKDVSDLLDSEVIWKDGRVIRKRSKTKHYEDVPTVNYPLWPSTFALLKEYRSGQDRVLLTQTGKPYVNRRMVDGKVRAVDAFGIMLRQLAKRCKVEKPLKQLRKTAASLLESHEVYGRCTSLFLGHSPKSMKEKHYAAPPQELFDAAVSWLGEKLGVAEVG